MSHEMHPVLLYSMLTLTALALKLSKAISLDIGQIKSQLERQRFSSDGLQHKIMETHEPQRAACMGCLEIRKHTKEYKLYLEYVKADILAKLGMKDRPRKAFSRSQIPAPIYEGKLLSMDDFGASRARLNNQIIIIGEKADKTICPTQDCFLFRLKKRAFIKSGIISSLQLWVYKLQDETLKNGGNRLSISVAAVSRQGILSVEVQERQNLLVSLVHDGDTGWLGMDSVKAKDWIEKLALRTEDIDLYLSLRCHGCVVARKGDKRPFFVVNVESEVKTRKKRAVRCHPKMKGCCRESLYVNFTEIGWDDWIVQPRGYDANYCRGSCQSSVPIYGYVTVIQKVLDKKPCCSPKSFSSLTILYKNDNIYKKVLPDMTVEDCACS